MGRVEREKECHVRCDANMQNKRKHHVEVSAGNCLGTKLREARKENESLPPFQETEENTISN